MSDPSPVARPCVLALSALTVLCALGAAAPATAQSGPAAPSGIDPEAERWAQAVLDTLSVPEMIGRLLVLRETDDGRAPVGAHEQALDELPRALLRTGAGTVSLCLSSARTLRRRVRALRDTSVLPIRIELHPACASSTEFEAPLTPAWTRSLLAAGDSELVGRLGTLLGRFGRYANLDAVSVPGWRTDAPFPDRSVDDTLSALARRLEDAYAAALERLDLSAAYRPDPPPPATARTLPVAGGGTDLAEPVLRTVTLADSDSPPAAAVRALERGAEQLYVSADDRTVRRALVQAVREGRIDTARIRTSAGRQLAASRAPSPAGFRSETDRSAARGAELDRSLRLMREEIARRATTLLVNRGAVLPFSPHEQAGAPGLFHVEVRGPSTRSGSSDLDRALEVAAGTVGLTHAVVGPHTGRSRYAELSMRAAAHRAIVLTVRSSGDGSPAGPILTDRQRNWIDNLNQRETPVVVVGLGDPRLARELDRPEALLLTYTSGPAAQVSAANALFGRAAIGGRLPRSLSASHPTGSGIAVPQQTLRRDDPGSVGMNPRTLSRIDAIVRKAIADSAFPGAAVAVGRAGALVMLRGYGHHTYESLRPVTPDSRFDLASLTKVTATTPAVMQLYETDRISLDAPVSEYWPAFGQNGKERVTVRHLLTHTSGLRPFHHPVHLIHGSPFFALPLPYTPFYRMEMLSREDMYGFIARDTLQYTPGTEYVYSDLGMIATAHLVERITDGSLETFLREEVYEPAGMRSTEFRTTGPSAVRPQIVPTEHDYSFRLRVVQGEVHDEAAYIMGGTSGHAGLFSNAIDLARYADLLVRGGLSPGGRIFRPRTINLFTRPVSPERHTRALGWDTRSSDGYSSAGELFGPASFGHTGFTGTSMWIDPDRDLYVILLTNRVYPNRYNRGHIDVRPAVADVAYRALEGPPVTRIPRDE